MRISITLASRGPGWAAATRHLERSLTATGATVDLGGPTGPGLTPQVVVVLADEPLASTADRALAQHALHGTPVILAGPTLSSADAPVLSQASGLAVVSTTPEHEIRLRPGPAAGALGDRLDPPILVRDRVTLVTTAAEDLAILLEATVGLVAYPVATMRPSTGVGMFSLGRDPQTWHDPILARLLLLVLRHAIGLAQPPAVRVGLLGYGAIGAEHATAVSSVPGLALAAVADRAPARVQAARELAPDITVLDAEELVGGDAVDLVVVSTAPNSHARWALAALRTGKHVVVEKPFATTTEAADEMLGESRSRGLTLAVYQNRRWDPDYLALRSAIRAGKLGEVFHLESFVGGYEHPCNYWHSDAEVSGGAVFDWGAHVIDQILDLMGAEVEWVSAATHKRVWFDVTNADHTRVTLRFADGAEAEFIHSNLAAALKPRWYVLGTQGAIVGSWRRERVVSRSPVGTLAEDVLAPADSPPVMERWDASGSRTLLACPAAPRYPFHHELADTLQYGIPMSVTAQDARRNVAVMVAAMRSVERGGQPVRPA
ncbi:MAG: Gfo/Idh/MocA family protein [Actinomycetes bacterium]